jgi:hypothetical protein
MKRSDEITEEVVVDTPEARITVTHVDEEFFHGEIARARAEGCKGCGSHAEQWRLVPGAQPQLGYRDGKTTGDMRDWVIESCPLCRTQGDT